MELMQSNSLLIGDNTIPGVKMPKEILAKIPVILQACRDFGLDFYDTIVEILTYDEISEVAAYDGFPVRYPHWRFGEQYEDLSKGYQHGYHRIYEMVINCLEPETPIATVRGTICAKDVKRGDQVIANGDTRRVVDVIAQKPSQTLTINLKNGRTLTCTPNHKWKALREDGPTWVKASELRIGEILLGGDTFHVFRDYPATFDWDMTKVLEETRANVRNRVKEVTPPKQMTLALAELLGIVLGDGSCGVRGAENYISVTVDNELPEYTEYVSRLAREVFGDTISVQNHRDSVDVVLISSKAAVDFMDAIGVTKGCTYKTKRVPWSIWRSSSEYRAAFLRGLFDTDGCASGHLTMNGYNHSFVQDVQLLLAEMGITSSVSRRDNNDGEISVLVVQGRESLFRFRERIGFAISYKAVELEHLTDSENCVSGGFTLPCVQERILEIAATYRISSYNERSLGRSVATMRRKLFSRNALYGFVFRALHSGYTEFAEVLTLLQTPMYEVAGVEEGPIVDTVDIVLDHDAHDFLANGVLSHNTQPCYIYCLDSNTLTDHVTVIAHATGHNHFFKNNVFFSQTSQNMMNELANHGSRIRRYISEWGKETVGRFIDKCLCIETLIDPAAAWTKRQIKDPVVRTKREYHFPRRLRVEAGHDYMEEWINTPEWRQMENDRIRNEELRKQIGIFENPTKDIFGFMKDNAPLTLWQQDILAMLYEEAMYFAPQRQTKTINEGFASFVDSQIMARFGFAEGEGIFDYALHKAGVLGGKTSMNPYKLGYQLFLWIEECWNKGKFGRDYEDCEDSRQRELWDKKLGLGHEKVFEVTQFYDDVTMIAEFFDQEFADKYEFFVWERFPNGTYKIVDRDARRIKQLLLKSKLNGGLPDIKLVDPNHKGKRIFLMEHSWDGRILHPQMTKDTLRALGALWQGPTAVLSKDKDGREIMYYCEEDKVEITTPGKV